MTGFVDPRATTSEVQRVQTFAALSRNLEIEEPSLSGPGEVRSMHLPSDP